MVSAITAVLGLVLAVFGIPLVGGSAVNRTIADSAGGDDSPSATGRPSSSGSSTSPQPSPSSLPRLPDGWRRVNAPKLTAVFAVPKGWTQRVDSDIQSTWHSPGDTHVLSLKRDTSYGSTAQAAAAGQLAWYRDTDRSSMAGVEVTTHTTRQNGRDALWLEIDYHWERQSEPRKRVEVFVAGSAGQVYQLLVDTAATPEKLAVQRELFAEARAQLLIDMGVGKPFQRSTSR